MPKQVERLTWKEGQYTSHRGSAGQGRGVELFTVTWKSRREDPDWLMRCYLPGLTSKEWKDNDLKVLQVRAEAVLSAWLESVNGGPLS